MEIENAIEILKDIYPSKKQIVTGEYPQVADALDEAIEALQEKQECEHPQPLTLEQLKSMNGEPVWWWNTTDKPRLTICNSAPYIPDVMFISFDWVKEDSTSITPYKKIVKWGYKPYAHNPKEEK